MKLLNRLFVLGVFISACVSQYAQAKTFNLDEGKDHYHGPMEDGLSNKFIRSVIVPPQHGTFQKVLETSDGRAVMVRYIPNQDFCGRDSFQYEIVSPSEYIPSDPRPDPPAEAYTAKPENLIATTRKYSTSDYRPFSLGPVKYTVDYIETVTYNVRCINDPTLLELPSSVDVNVGGTKTVDIHASDVDSSDFSIAVVSSSNSALLPIGNITLTQNEQIRYEGGLYQASWQMNIKPLADMAGYATVQLQSTDSAGLTKTYTVDIYVRPFKFSN
ncbi:hypothetical protein, partial [Pseudoalteromonas piscicida]